MADDRESAKVLSLASSAEPSELIAALHAYERNAHAMIKFNRARAHVQRQAFLAYCEEGFTSAEALELAKGC